MKGKPLTIRTIDLGVDKTSRWSAAAVRPTPQPIPPGLTGIRLCHAEPMLFRTQMRAVLRAAPCTAASDPCSPWSPACPNTGKAYPSGNHKRQLTERGEALFGSIETGCMIEIPSRRTHRCQPAQNCRFRFHRHQRPHPIHLSVDRKRRQRQLPLPTRTSRHH